MASPLVDESALTLEWLSAVSAGKPGHAQIVNLAEATSDVVIETAITGASQLTVTLSDPAGELLTSGFLDTDADGYLQDVLVVYPPGFRWALCAVDWSTDLSQPNLTLTFEDRIVFDMRQHWGPKKATRSPSMTRARFIRSLAHEAGIPFDRFICPELLIQQPIAGNTGTDVQPIVPGSNAVSSGPGHKTNPKKKQGIAFNSGATIEGKPLTQEQITNVETALGEASKLNAPDVVAQAIVVAGIGESRFLTHNQQPRTKADGVFQLIPSTASALHLSPYDTAGTAKHWLTDGYYKYGGGIDYAKKHPHASPGEIATAVEGSFDPPSAGAAFYNAHLDDANSLIKAYGWMGAAGISTGEQGTYAFTRGTTDNQDEDSWTAANRLASEVNWSLFSNGDRLYYMDGIALIAQKPALVLDREGDEERIAHLGFTWDNTAFTTRSTHKVKGKIQRSSHLQRANTPTEGRLDLVCGIDDYRAGDVFELKGCGPADGRWIVSDATRSIFNTYTEFRLSPPTSPLPEPAGQTKTSSSSGGSAASGGSGGPLLGTLPPGTKFQWKRYDQGQDIQTDPGVAIQANGDGTAHVHSDAGGFGTNYCSVAYTSGPFKGSEIYYGHCPAVVSENQKVHEGDVLAHTGTAADVHAGKTGNASSPGWLEIGEWPPGSMSAGLGIAKKLGNPHPSPS